MPVQLTIIRQVAADQVKTEQADRQVDEKDDAPVKVAHDEAADDGAKHGADQTGNGYEAHGADEFRFGKGPHERQPAHRHHHGSAEALQDTAGDEQMDVV